MKGRRQIGWAAAIAILLFAAISLFLVFRWPFTPARLTVSLENDSHTTVAVRGASMFFFPSPGAILDNVDFRRRGQSLATARRLRITGSWMSLFTFQHHISELQADGLVLTLPDDIPAPDHAGTGKPPKTTVHAVILDGAVLNTHGMRFQFDRLRLSDIGANQRFGFDAVLQSPAPRSRLAARGTLGPWNSQQPGRIPASGTFELTEADLAQYHGLAGILDAKGKASGTLSSMQVNGTAHVAQFEVDHNGHPVDLQIAYDALADGMTGDTVLNSVQSHFLHTDVNFVGSVKGSPDKTVEVDFESKTATVQDVLLLTTKAQPPTLSGPIALRAHAIVPPDDIPFLKKLQLRGAFTIPRARFNKPSTQQKVDELSARAEDSKELERVSSSMSASVDMHNGVANLRNCKFEVPGAVATGGGTYNLLSKDIHLDGTVDMKATVSEASTGLKKIILKPFNAAFRNRKRNAGAELPVHVTGRYPNPQFQINLTGKKRRS